MLHKTPQELRKKRFEKSNLAKLHKTWECAQSTQENFRLCCYL